MVKTCVVCGLGFDGHPNAKVCGPECAKERDNQRRKERRANDPEYKQRLNQQLRERRAKPENRKQRNQQERKRYAERMANDAPFQLQMKEQNQRGIKRRKERYANDPEYRQQQNQYNNNRYHNNPLKSQHNKKSQERYANDPDYRRYIIDQSIKYRKWRRENEPGYTENLNAKARQRKKERMENEPEYKQHRLKQQADYRADPANKEKLRQKGAKRRNLKAGLPYDWCEDDWINALEYFDYSCAACEIGFDDDNPPSQDHWIPVSYGGDDNPGFVPTNIVPLCGHCNSSKHNKPAYEWLVWKFGEDRATVILSRVEYFFDWIARI